MGAPTYADAMTANAADEPGTAKPSLWAKLRHRRSGTGLKSFAAIVAFLWGLDLAQAVGGSAAQWILTAAVLGGIVVWLLLRPPPEAARSRRRHDPWRDAE